MIKSIVADAQVIIASFKHLHIVIMRDVRNVKIFKKEEKYLFY